MEKGQTYSYEEFSLRIDRGDGGAFRIVASGPGGEASNQFTFPFSNLEIENFLLKVGRTRIGVRRIDSPEMSLVRDFGQKLFQTVFQGSVRDVYRSSLDNARNSGKGLRITFYLSSAPELMDIPWEFLYEDPGFLSISTWTPIVRYLDLPRPPEPLLVEPPLRILCMASSPNDAVPLNVKQEREKLERALRNLLETGLVSIDWLERATLRELQRKLRQGTYHVFHYIGHSNFDSERKDGMILVEDEEGERGRAVSGTYLGTLLGDHESLRLAVLNSCEGARTSRDDPFSGVAQSLVQRGIPAVVAMQFEITDDAAVTFSDEFYSSLSNGYPVDSAVTEARKAIFADRNDIEWGTPALFMRVSDGHIFDIHPQEKRQEPQLLLDLHQIPPIAYPGQPVEWTLMITNGGDATLKSVSPIRALGQALSTPFDLNPGQNRIVSWTSIVDKAGSEIVEVSALDISGRRFVRRTESKLNVRERHGKGGLEGTSSFLRHQIPRAFMISIVLLLLSFGLSTVAGGFAWLAITSLIVVAWVGPLRGERGNRLAISFNMVGFLILSYATGVAGFAFLCSCGYDLGFGTFLGFIILPGTLLVSIGVFLLSRSGFLIQKKVAGPET